MQLNHYNTNFGKIPSNIILLCDSVNSPANIGSLFRIADSFGVQKIIFGGESKVDLKSSRLKRTARATQNKVAMEDTVSLPNYISELSKLNYQVYALEITDKSKSIDLYKFPINKKIALVIGDESAGVSSKVLDKCDEQLHISMYGENSSMNVSQAAAIALYEITKQLK